MKDNFAVAYSVKKRGQHKAEGGHVGNGACEEHGAEDCSVCMAKGGEAGMSISEKRKSRRDSRKKSERERANEMGHSSMAVHDRKLENFLLTGDQHKSDKSRKYAEGGDVVDSIMKKRCYSHGGQVANEVEPLTDDASGEFDVLVKDGDFDPTYAGTNEIGNETVDQEERDVVSAIMRSRKKRTA